jgi:hypothetical protein
MSDVEEQTKKSVEEVAPPVADGGKGGFSLKERFIGDYAYGRFCKPRLNPWKKENNEPMPFYGRNAHLAWLVTIMLGFQHSLAVSYTD